MDFWATEASDSCQAERQLDRLCTPPIDPETPIKHVVLAGNKTGALLHVCISVQHFHLNVTCR